MLRKIFCTHFWTNNLFDVPNPKRTFLRVGAKDYRTNESWWGCVRCGKVRVAPYAFIPINPE